MNNLRHIVFTICLWNFSFINGEIYLENDIDEYFLLNFVTLNSIRVQNTLLNYADYVPLAFNELGKHKYYYKLSPTSFTGANQLCLTQKAKLYVMESTEELTQLREKFRAQKIWVTLSYTIGQPHLVNPRGLQALRIDSRKMSIGNITKCAVYAFSTRKLENVGCNEAHTAICQIDKSGRKEAIRAATNNKAQLSRALAKFSVTQNGQVIQFQPMKKSNVALVAKDKMCNYDGIKQKASNYLQLPSIIGIFKNFKQIFDIAFHLQLLTIKMQEFADLNEDYSMEGALTRLFGGEVSFSPDGGTICIRHPNDAVQAAQDYTDTQIELKLAEFAQTLKATTASTAATPSKAMTSVTTEPGVASIPSTQPNQIVAVTSEEPETETEEKEISDERAVEPYQENQNNDQNAAIMQLLEKFEPLADRKTIINEAIRQSKVETEKIVNYQLWESDQLRPRIERMVTTEIHKPTFKETIKQMLATEVEIQCDGENAKVTVEVKTENPEENEEKFKISDDFTVILDDGTNKNLTWSNLLTYYENMNVFDLSSLVLVIIATFLAISNAIHIIVYRVTSGPKILNQANLRNHILEITDEILEEKLQTLIKSKYGSWERLIPKKEKSSFPTLLRKSKSVQWDDHFNFTRFYKPNEYFMDKNQRPDSPTVSDFNP